MENLDLIIKLKWRNIIPQVFLIIWLILPIAKIQSQDKPSMTIWMKDGSSEVFLLEEKPKVQYIYNTITISSSNIEQAYWYSEVKKITYSNIKTSDIENIINDNDLGIVQEGENLRIKGLPKNSLVSIYSIDGNLIYQIRTKEDNNVFINFGNFSSGVYILKAGTKSIKYFKR